jgi:nucleoside-diphosphate-sugar epimerase
MATVPSVVRNTAPETYAHCRPQPSVLKSGLQKIKPIVTLEKIGMKRVLLTGAAGRVGTAFRRFHGDDYALRLVDRPGVPITDAAPHEVLAADLADLAACQQACAGMDMVIHLAADASPRADFYGSLLDNNIKAAYNIFHAAKEQGCQRVIFASSIQAIEGYPLDTQPHPEMLPKPMNLYAVTKVLGESLCHYFAYAEGLSSIAVRIGAFEGNRDWSTITEPVDSRTLSAFVSERDLSHLFVQCLETPDVRFAVVHGVSDNRFKRMDLTSTRNVVGYRPQDDAFERFNTGIPHPKRWYEEWQRGQPTTK